MMSRVDSHAQSPRGIRPALADTGAEHLLWQICNGRQQQVHASDTGQPTKQWALQGEITLLCFRRVFPGNLEGLRDGRERLDGDPKNRMSALSVDGSRPTCASIPACLRPCCLTWAHMNDLRISMNRKAHHALGSTDFTPRVAFWATSGPSATAAPTLPSFKSRALPPRRTLNSTWARCVQSCLSCIGTYEANYHNRSVLRTSTGQRRRFGARRFA